MIEGVVAIGRKFTGITRIYWLDEMIRKAKREWSAGMALRGLLAHYGNQTQEIGALRPHTSSQTLCWMRVKQITKKRIKKMQGTAKSVKKEGFEFVQVDLSKFDAIKSHRWLRDKPKWFLDEYNKGNISPVKNSKEEHVTMRNKNASFNCSNGDFIVRNPVGLLFWMPEHLFYESMEIVNEQ